ncbi:MAG: hypothetical protein ACPG4U_11210 [Pseudomonadales bacterium]
MKKTNTQWIAALALTLFTSASSASGSIDHSAKGSSQIVKGSGNIAAGSAYSAASAVAVPLISIGAVGIASAATGSAAINHSHHDHDAHKPLPITERVIIQDPAPNLAIQ